ncbi:hypothetical protein L484_018846 [Morus notabilis]|uniref:Uncharacterized protein n=1 Tax=Morus notabilis TaxID=981085 RepID=W9SE53_9ROSA|nr:hypothetical protein L484_018846 [Morus notabilis]
MSEEVLQSKTKRHANFRLRYVSSFATELLEIQADEPTFHVLFIPGNPGVVTFYIDFMESLFELLGGLVGHISHTKQNWEHGMLFSLQEQIDHKVEFIKQEFPNNEVPIILYHTMRNILFLVHTEFEKLAEMPDWEFMRDKKEKIAFLFGSDDHWGPLQFYEEISRQVPGIALSIERKGQGHYFCCFEDCSYWVAHHVATLINNQISRSRSSSL